MPQFRYRVRDKFGKLITGTIGGDDERAVATHFESMGYAPVSISREATTENISFMSRFKNVSMENLNLFNRQLVTLIKAGLPLLAGLNAIEKQTECDALRDIIRVIVKDIEGGSSFSEALTRHPRVFNEMYVSAVKAGEVGGVLDDILLRLAELGEHDAKTKDKITTATRYPLITIIFLVGGFFVLVTWVVPRFVSLFARFEGELPLPTKILIFINEAIRSYWYICLTVLAVLIVAFRKFTATHFGQKLWDAFKLKVPIFGPLVFMIIMSRFCRITAILIRSGVPILGILDMVSNATGNVVIGDAIKDIMASVNEGGSMAEPMAKSKVFTPMVIQMVSIGEETGKVVELLLRVSEYYDLLTDYMIANLTTMIEPILVVVIGCAVLMLALAIFLPMWNMIQLFKT